ncbi:hypothetical protein [Leifsonia sp. NCR5]|uniref:hypothetical protein n=1 Tax=Leifsonia sp. NCR5 TaxID=1978342 RepID=UPI000A19841D|nr:hypothetical protein [Leifsonia sp. NCR5]
MKTHTSTARAALAASAVVLAVLGALSGCAGSAPATSHDPSASAISASTSTGTTPTPAPAALSPNDPIDALTAWHACAVLGLENYVAQNPGAALHPYDASVPPTKNPDGSFQAIASFSLPKPVEGAKSIVYICTIGGTLGNPTLLNVTTKDV